ncbi:hypothetical protein [uncultured Tateyamaria sp.]|uniref:hypothetical protein n=1 Tax=uncultured Tateyamaria sp. TaxID=455651 RepID=UPI00261D2775|nr:hypothetical protein [uncultured Tateyamaria sp.]
MGAAPLKILADQVATMHWMLVSEAIARCANAEVVAHNVPTENLEAAIATHTPEVLILGAADTVRRPDILEKWMQSGGPDRRIITLFNGPAQIQLREWRQEVATLNDISVGSLCAAIEGGA